MTITNTKGLPLPIVAAIAHDDHVSQGSDIGASTLSAPVKQVALRRLHREEIVEDASERIWALLGQAVHVVLERAGKAEDAPFSVFREERWEMNVLGWRVAARCDHLTLDGDGTLTDYKVSSVWSVKDGKPKDDWVAQLNVTRLIGHAAAGLDPKALQAVVICRDWRMNEKKRYGAEYPETQVVAVPVPLWSLDETRAYLEQRVVAHQAAQLEGKLPDCTPEERWEKPTLYAVTKKGNKTAVRLYEQRAQADAHAASQPNLHVVVRPGESPRCQQYCDALAFCEQGQRIVAATKAAE